jgi:hypothetical protein
MKTVVLGIAAATVLGAFAALGYAIVENNRAQSMRMDAMLHELARLRTDAAEERSALHLRLAQNESLGVAPTAVDSASANAIANSVVVAIDGREKERARAAQEPSVATPAELAARDQAERELASAITRGHLRREDVLAMRQSLASDPVGRAELASRIAVAINHQELVVDDPRAAFP